jgi:hypothetical protein
MLTLGKVLRKSLPVFVSLALWTLVVQPSFAPIIPTEGCTPGFWKNPIHFDQWVDFNPTDSIGAVLTAAYPEYGLTGWTWPTCISGLYGDTLLEVLQYKGGPELEDGAQIFLRQAVAALLNAANPEVDALDVGLVIYGVRLVLALCDRDAYIFYAGFYMGFNELGCPLRRLF